MKTLFIGGTGLISSACSDLAAARRHELFILNRSTPTKHPNPEDATILRADVYSDEARIASLPAGHRFDAVVDFHAYTVDDIERDIRLFRGTTNQIASISSTSAYQKPSIAVIRASLTYGSSQIPLMGASWLHSYTVIDRMKRGEKVIIPGDGASPWVLTWNADFATGLIALLGNEEAVGKAFQITSDKVFTWNPIFLEVYQGLDLEPNMIHIHSDLIAAHDPSRLGTLLGDKIHSIVFDNREIKHFVHEFDCEVTWADGLRRSLAWFESHPELPTIDEKMNALYGMLYFLCLPKPQVRNEI